jgi:hypothetical protein
MAGGQKRFFEPSFDFPLLTSIMPNAKGKPTSSAGDSFEKATLSWPLMTMLEP